MLICEPHDTFSLFYKSLSDLEIASVYNIIGENGIVRVFDFIQHVLKAYIFFCLEYTALRNYI